MTTIVYKDGVLASDSQVTLSNGKVASRSFNKIFEPKDALFQGQKVLAYGMAGDAASRLILDRLMMEEGGLYAGDNLESEDDFEAILVCEESLFFVEKSGDKPAIRAVEISGTEGWAIGSGAAIATHYLLKGASAEEAVKEAMVLDLFSGGELCVWKRETSMTQK